MLGSDTAAGLIGLWGCERTFGPEVQGRLTIVEKEGAWRAEIGGFTVPAECANGDLAFSLPGGRGEFQGHRISEEALFGHWIQPSLTAGKMRYATPVEIDSVHPQIWRGQVAPLEDRRSFYLIVQPGSDGALKAFLRNPESNAGLSLPVEKVSVEGDSVRFTRRENEEEALVGRWDRERGILSLYVPRYGLTFDFTRRSPEEATGFFPRTPPVSSYRYRPPLPDDDGWPVGSLAEAGLGPVPLARLVEQILTTETTSVETSYIHSLLIARQGKLVFEEYFYGFHRDRAHDWRSAGKSLASTLVGIALDQDAPFDLTTPISTLFPQYPDLAASDPCKQKITVEHLLTMTSGLEGDDNDAASPGNEMTMWAQTHQPDWYRYTLALPMVREPGERGVYFTAGIHLLGGIIETATHTWLPDFLYMYFAKPLDIRRYHLSLTPQNAAYMGGGIFMRPRDFLKLGQLFLDRGRWKGRQVVSEEWVERATRAHAGIKKSGDYGYAWWIWPYTVEGRTYRAFSALGNGGQSVIVFPELDMVVSSTAGNYGSDIDTLFRDWFVPEFILPSLKGP